MATGQGILDRLRKAREHRGVLPLLAFYARDEVFERRRNAFYAKMDVALAQGDAEIGYGGRGRGFRLVDVGQPVVINENSGPIEYLAARSELEGDEDPEGMGGARFHTALRLRDLFDGAQVKGLRSPSMGGVGGGGGSGTAADNVRGYQIDCMKLLDRVRAGMEKPWLFPMLESIIWNDDWLDLWPVQEEKEERRSVRRKERRKTITALHFALDSTALTLGYLQADEFTQRWSRAPGIPPSVRRRMRASTVEGPLALRTSPGARSW